MARVIAVDTNVLLRVLLDDAGAQSQSAAARGLVQRADAVHISVVVFVETLWTLQRSYGYPKALVAKAADGILTHPKYRVESAGQLRRALERYSTGNIDFADAVALEHALECEAPLHTFDKKLAKLKGAQLLG